MSEPSSLYARVRLTASAFAAFQASPLTLPGAYTDWHVWLDGQRYYGQISDDQIATAAHPEPANTVGAYLAETAAMSAFGLGSHYDPVTETWLFRLIECSENYIDFLLILSVLRAVAHYKDLPADPANDDFILIYPFLWGGAPNAYVVITSGTSYFGATIPPTAIQEADASFTALYEALRAQVDLDEI